MPRSRIIISWVVFGLGVVAILFGGYGLLTHSPWSDTVNSLCTIFGTMMSFSQFFVGFPTSLKLSRDKVAPASPIVSPQRLGTAPPHILHLLIRPYQVPITRSHHSLASHPHLQ